MQYCFGSHFLRVFSIFSPKGNNFFSKLFLIKGSHFITEYLEKIWFSLMLPSGAWNKKWGLPKQYCFGSPFLKVFSIFSLRGNNFCSKLFLTKVSHFITEHMKKIWFSLMLTLWCLEQKMGAPKAIITLAAPF